MTPAALCLLAGMLPGAADRAAAADLGRFPSHQAAEACVALAEGYVSAARKRWAASPASWQDAAGEEVAEAEFLRDAWQALACATSSWASGPYHRDRLRQLLGEPAWSAGRMPPAVPLWRFRTPD